MRKRADLLMEIIHNPRPDMLVIQGLAAVESGFEMHLVIVSRSAFLNTLRQFENGILSAAELKAWAKRLFELPDIGFEFGDEGALEEATFMLAHDEIHGMADSRLCQRIEAMLERRGPDRSSR